MVDGTLTRASALGVGLGVSRWTSPLDHTLVQRIRVIGVCVIWVWWVSYRYLGGHYLPLVLSIHNNRILTK
jgi:hypothetical protein